MLLPRSRDEASSELDGNVIVKLREEARGSALLDC